MDTCARLDAPPATRFPPAPPRRPFLVVTGAAAAGVVLAGCRGMGGTASGGPVRPAAPDAWLEQVRGEHRAVLALFDRMIAADDPAQRATLRDALAEALTVHAVGEENAIYPALAMAGAPTDVQQLYAEHAQLKVLLAELDVLPKDHAAWPGRARNLRALVAKHAQDEESRLYPAFTKAMTSEQNAALSGRYAREHERFRGG